MTPSPDSAPTLAEFLLARIAEDQAKVDGLVQRYPHETQYGGWYANGDDVTVSLELGRALAECEAKRRIVELHRVTTSELVGIVDDHGRTQEPDDFERIVHARSSCFTCRVDHPDGECPTLRLLALPYADHPDFREEWRP